MLEQELCGNARMAISDMLPQKRAPNHGLPADAGIETSGRENGHELGASTGGDCVWG
jgi:hypothetical protein